MHQKLVVSGGILQKSLCYLVFHMIIQIGIMALDQCANLLTSYFVVSVVV